MDGPLINIGDERSRGENENASRNSPNDVMSNSPASTDSRQVAATSNAVCGDTGFNKSQTGSSSKSTSTKHDRLKRSLSMDEDCTAAESGVKKLEEAKPVSACGGSCYGVRSYLDQFYDLTGSFKDPDLYEEDPDLLLLADSRRGSTRLRRWCGAKCWKITAIVGFICLLAGIVAIGVGILIPRRPPRPETALVPQTVPAAADDQVGLFNAEVCRLAGLVMFCVGGLVLAVALLVPSFPSSRQCCVEIEDDDWHTSYCALDDDFETPTHVSALRSAAQSIKAAVPATKKLTGIQPARVAGQTTLTCSDIPY